MPTSLIKSQQKPLMIIIDPPELDRSSSREELEAWLNKLQSFDHADPTILKIEIMRVERWLRKHNELVAKRDFKD